MGHLSGELAAFGLALGFSPLHIGLLLLLLVGERPLPRGCWFVAGWLLTTAVAMALLLSVGHGLLLTMEKGSGHRTGLDLLAAGGLLALGLRELLDSRESSAAPGWTQRLDQLCALPLPALLGLSAVLQLAAPDDVFLLAKAAASVLAAGLSTLQELSAVLVFALASGLLLLLPLLLLLACRRDTVLPLLDRGKRWLFSRGDVVVGMLSLGLAAYLGWQGVEGLRLGLGA